MGAALSVSNATAINNIVSETVQIAQNFCTADCSQFIGGVDIILDGSTVGDITFSQTCEANASCMMTNALDQTVDLYQLAEADAEANLPILPIGFQAAFAEALTTNDVETSMKQVLENHCSAEIDQVIQDVLIYATNSTTGDIGFIQDGNANAQCVMDNSGRIKLSVSQTGKATATAGLSFAGIIALIIIIIIIVMVIAAVRKKMKDDERNSDQGCGQGNTVGQNQQCIGPDGQPIPGRFAGGRSGAGRSSISSSDVGNIARGFQRAN